MGYTYCILILGMTLLFGCGGHTVNKKPDVNYQLVCTKWSVELFCQKRSHDRCLELGTYQRCVCWDSL